MKIHIPEQVQHIIAVFQKNGYEAYAVGGCIRDSLIGREPSDWDITTNAKPEKIISLFPHTIPTGLKHGTITVLLQKSPYEVTTYRIDGVYTDNRHPDEVIFTNSLWEDLGRRDFTINALAYNDDFGVIDPFKGLMDMDKKIIKCVGDPITRFNEDALRMLRAIRFSCQLNFNIAADTFLAIQDNCALIQNVSVERIRDELCKILLCTKPSLGIIALKDSGLLKYILPEIIPTIDLDQRNPHHDKDVFNHTLAVVDNTPKNIALRLGALLHDIGKPSTMTVDEKGIGHFYGHEVISTDISREILRRMKFDNITINKVLMLVKEHMKRFLELNPKSTKKLMLRVGLANLEDLYSLQIADIKASAPPHDFSYVDNFKKHAANILKEKQPLTIKDLAITGEDLLNLGYKQDKRLGETLNYLLEKVLENPQLNNKEALIKLLQ